MLTVTNLTKSFPNPDGGAPTTIVNIPSLHLAPGDQVALIGSSGSGKTTLLHLLAGILAPTTGSIVYTLPQRPPSERPPSPTARGNVPSHAIDLAQLTEPQRDHFRGQHIGYIFQTHHLLPGLSALENVLLGMAFTGRHADKPFAQHLLDRVGLSHRLHYKPSKLSVGQQQRVAVARALANRPALVLADEPTGALDRATALQTLALIRDLCTEISAALLMVTHDLSLASQLPRQLDLAHLNTASTGRGVT